MNLEFLPHKFLLPILKCDLNNIIEIRLRANFPIILVKTGDKCYLGYNGQTLLKSNALNCTKVDIEEIILNLTERSIYAYSEQLNNGFISWKDGVRVGLTGDFILDNNNVISIKNVCSLNIRLPHEIIDVSNKIFDKICENQIYNTLIVSKPLKGKTTILKDLIRKFNFNTKLNLLVIDERGELSNCGGENVDLIRYCTKRMAFEIGLRTMSPEIVFTDEIISVDDEMWIRKAIGYGINVIATCHGNDYDGVKMRNFDEIFDLIIILDDHFLGEINKIIYCKNKS